MLTYLTGEKGYVHLVQGQEVKSFIRTSDQQTRMLPFSLSLDSFRVVYYPGTEAPSDYKSYVGCKVNGQWKEEVISMNHILSVEGYRFYQFLFLVAVRQPEGDIFPLVTSSAMEKNGTGMAGSMCFPVDGSSSSGQCPGPAGCGKAEDTSGDIPRPCGTLPYPGP